MEAATTRERIDAKLRAEACTISTLAAAFDISRGAARTHLRHVARSVDTDADEFMVRPPACLDCGFDGFDALLKEPSRCPRCKSESIREPAFRIREAGDRSDD